MPHILSTLLTLTPLVSPPPAPQEPLVIHGATVIPMSGNPADGEAPVLSEHSLVVVGDEIRWIGPMDEAPLEGRVVDARGLFVIPGLIDAHVHLFDEDQLPLYLANGVTSVFNLSGTPFALKWREEIRNGSRVGPRSFATGPQIKEAALSVVDTEFTLPTQPEDIKSFVRAHREVGFEFVKVWSSIAPVAYENILAECRRHGVRVTGHVPSRVGLRGVLHSGQDSIAHVEEILNKFLQRSLDERGLDAVRTIAEEEDFTIISTLITYEMIADTMTDERLQARMARDEYRYLEPLLVDLWASPQNDWYRLRTTDRGATGYYDEALVFMSSITRVLHEAGIPVLAGSDSGMFVSNILPGWSLHRELELLTGAGLSALETLASATSNSGTFLAPGTSLGMLAVGAPADLVVLTDNPLETISHTRTIQAVVARGRYLDRAALDGLLADVEARQDVARVFRNVLVDDGVDAAIEWAQAESEADRALPGEASFVAAMYHHVAAEQLNDAIQIAELWCELRPTSYRSAHTLAGLLELSGELEPALELFRVALELAPDHPWLPVHIERLRVALEDE